MNKSDVIIKPLTNVEPVAQRIVAQSFQNAILCVDHSSYSIPVSNIH